MHDYSLTTRKPVRSKGCAVGFVSTTFSSRVSNLRMYTPPRFVLLLGVPPLPPLPRTARPLPLPLHAFPGEPSLLPLLLSLGETFRFLIIGTASIPTTLSWDSSKAWY
jgi:hypothetical protein